MRKKKIIIFFLTAALLLSACQEKNRGFNGSGSKSVDDVLNEKTSEAVKTDSGSDGGNDTSRTDSGSNNANANIGSENTTAREADIIEPEDSNVTTDATDGVITYTADKITTDTTFMGKDMVYASIYNLMMDPITHTNEIVKIKGVYVNQYDETTEKYYHFCLIKDAMACCQQGMEFVWDDGSRIYPDEYPEVGTEIIITGRFETYKDSPDAELTFCRLGDAVLEVVD